jgi:putative endonuclease
MLVPEVIGMSGRSVTGAVGRYGERMAGEHLEKQGMRVIDRNWRTARGEIDIVAVDGECLVVCEVKTRRSGVCGDPFDAVTPLKLARLRRLAAAWLAEHQGFYRDVRIDVVAVHRPSRGPARIEHLRGVS